MIEVYSMRSILACSVTCLKGILSLISILCPYIQLPSPLHCPTHTPMFSLKESRRPVLAFEETLWEWLLHH